MRRFLLSLVAATTLWLIGCEHGSPSGIERVCICGEEQTYLELTAGKSEYSTLMLNSGFLERRCYWK